MKVLLMIKLSYNIEKYREQLFETVEDEDVIIELGCHVGKTTERVLKKYENCRIIAMDNSPEAVAEMEKLEEKYNNLTFISGDVRLHDKIKEVFEACQTCDILSIDLGGGYHPDTVFKVFYIWSSTFKPRSTLIRNKGLIDFCNSAIKTDEDFNSNEGYLSSHGDEGIPPQIKEFDLWSSSLKNNKKVYK